jgi:hypothetical protein
MEASLLSGLTFVCEPSHIFEIRHFAATPGDRGNNCGDKKIVLRAPNLRLIKRKIADAT